MPHVHERFEETYIPRITAFIEDISEIETSGIPEPHIPHWGIKYESSPLKIGIIGIDTRSWGEGGMPGFIDAVNMNPRQALYRGKKEFDSLKFTEWTNNFGTTFWDTSLKILAAMHSVSDWKQLKRQEVTTPLKQFFWANVNSVEKFESSPQKNKVPEELWHRVKIASERHLDSFRTILDVFRPDVVFLMNWEPGKHFLDFSLEWTEFGDHQAAANDPVTGCLVLATAHPTWLNRNKLYDEAINGLIQRANKAV